MLYRMRISTGTFREASLFHPIINKLVQSAMSVKPLARSVGLQNAIEMALSLGHKTKIKEKQMLLQSAVRVTVTGCTRIQSAKPQVFDPGLSA